MWKEKTTLRSLLNQITEHPDRSLVFETDGKQIRPGYHVTEIKQVDVRSVDCGHGQNAWREMVVQLLDGRAGSDAQSMTVGKFAAIAQTGVNLLAGAEEIELWFEYAPDNGPMQKLSVRSVDQTTERVTVSLVALSAACKPMERAWATDSFEQSAGDASCCRPSTSEKCCASSVSPSGCCT